MDSGIKHRAGESGDLSVRLLGGLRVCHGDRAVPLSGDGRRLVAFLALERTWFPRSFVAGSLWLDVTQERAFGNLRSALWRVRSRDVGLIHTDGDMVSLCPDATVDVERARDVAAALFAGTALPISPSTCVDMFARELLPGWYDEFIVVERESLRQLSLHALESLAGRLSGDGHYADAMRAAMAAVRLDRLRESAHRCVICIHIAEGNYSEARLQYDAYADLLERELGLAPSPTMNELVDALPLASDATADSLRVRSAPTPPPRRPIRPARTQIRSAS